jgi:hypothetical protein
MMTAVCDRLATVSAGFTPPNKPELDPDETSSEKPKPDEDEVEDDG